MTRHVKLLYLEWKDGRPPRRQEIDRHLNECGECRRYFDEMDRFLDPALLAGAPRLAPDPFLPGRVAALSAMKRKFDIENRPSVLLLVAQGAAFAAAVVIGILIGMSISQETPEGDLQEIVNLYRDAVQQEDATFALEVILHESEGGLE